jgi:hypothetical protein
MIVIVLAVREVHLPVPLREKVLHTPADQLPSRAGEEPFGFLVHKPDLSPVVDFEDRVRRRFKELTEARVH